MRVMMTRKPSNSFNGYKRKHAQTGLIIIQEIIIKESQKLYSKLIRKLAQIALKHFLKFHSALNF